MFITNNPKRALMFIMGALVLVGFGVAQLIYKQGNAAVDPRIVHARELYSTYNTVAQANNFTEVLALLDSIELVYSKVYHYKNSYEIGVLYNNRAAAYLSMALYFENHSLSIDGIHTLSKDTLLYLSELAVLQSIKIYNNWLVEFKELDKQVIKSEINESFFTGFEITNLKEKERFLAKRVKEISEAQIETPRRLSVAYTNLGIIKRHYEQYDEAIQHYKQALDLWDKNLAAENNMNTLLGRPHKKLNLIQRIFPSERVK